MGERTFLEEDSEEFFKIIKNEDGTEFIIGDSSLESEMESRTITEELMLTFPETVKLRDLIQEISAKINSLEAKLEIMTLKYKETVQEREREIFEEIINVPTEIITLTETNRDLANSYIELSKKHVKLTENYNQLVKDYQRLTEENNRIIEGLTKRIEDLQLYAKPPSLTNEKLNKILVKYLEEEDE